MASIYRFTRKRKQEDTKHTAHTIPKDDFPLLLVDSPSYDEDLLQQKENKAAPNKTEPNDKQNPVIESPAEETVEEKTVEFPVEKAEEEKVVEVNSAKPSDSEEKTESEAVSEAEKTRSFSLEEAEAIRKVAMERAKNAPEELLKALETTPTDAEKVGAVYGAGRGTVSGETTKEEFDKTTELLNHLFGKGSSSKKDPVTDAETQVIPPIPEETEAEAEKAEPTENAGDQYVAVHDGQEESTREYQTAFSIQEELEKIIPEELVEKTPELAEEVNVPDQDNPYHDTYDELDTTVEKHAVLPEEYTSEEEYDEFAEHLRNNNFKSLCTAFWTLITFFVILYLESATFSDLYHPEFLKPGGIYNMIYLLVDMQLILVSSLLILPSLGNGFKSLFCGKPNRNTVAAVFTVLSLIHAGAMLFLGQTQYPLFGSLAALFALFVAIANHLDSKRIYRTFRICGKRCTKVVASEVAEDSAELEAFRDQLKGEPRFFSVQKANFIGNFFSRIKERPHCDSSFGWTVAVSLILSLGFSGFVFWQHRNLAEAFRVFAMMTAMTFPLSGILSVSLPFSHLAKKAERRDCAIISVAAAEKYASCDVVSFTDNEIFPPKSVKVSTIRTYGQTRIDNAILYAAMIFQKLGGPLSHVFKKTISGVYTEIPEDFDFLEITADGMCAKIDGKDVFVGNKNYLLSYDFGYTKDEMDEEFESRSGKIMYMVIGSELAAKFYIRYAISKRFKKTILALFKSGICPAVKTCDPNIDSDLFRTLLQNDKIPAGIVKTCDAMKDAPHLEVSDSGLVCNSSIANLLHSFTLCDALKHLVSANAVMRLLSILVGAGIVVFLYFIENTAKVSGAFALIYQILWTIPIIVPSLTE